MYLPSDSPLNNPGLKAAIITALNGEGNLKAKVGARQFCGTIDARGRQGLQFNYLKDEVWHTCAVLHDPRFNTFVMLFHRIEQPGGLATPIASIKDVSFDDLASVFDCQVA